MNEYVQYNCEFYIKLSSNQFQKFISVESNFACVSCSVTLPKHVLIALSSKDPAPCYLSMGWKWTPAWYGQLSMR